MRYIFRRPAPSDLNDLKSQINNLDTQLGRPGENFRREIRVPFTPMRYAQFMFFTKKVGTDWVWVAPSVELVAEDEAGLFALTEKFHIPKPSHLAHL